MNLDYYTSREFHNIIRIHSRICTEQEFIEGSRRIRTQQDFEGSMSGGTPVRSIDELEKAFVDLCGLKNLTGKQFLE
jgi:hypothetical protein